MYDRKDENDRFFVKLKPPVIYLDIFLFLFGGGIALLIGYWFSRSDINFAIMFSVLIFIMGVLCSILWILNGKLFVFLVFKYPIQKYNEGKNTKFYLWFKYYLKYFLGITWKNDINNSDQKELDNINWASKSNIYMNFEAQDIDISTPKGVIIEGKRIVISFIALFFFLMPYVIQFIEYYLPDITLLGDYLFLPLTFFFVFPLLSFYLPVLHILEGSGLKINNDDGTVSNVGVYIHFILDFIFGISGITKGYNLIQDTALLSLLPFTTYNYSVYFLILGIILILSFPLLFPLLYFYYYMYGPLMNIIRIELIHLGIPIREKKTVKYDLSRLRALINEGPKYTEINGKISFRVSLFSKLIRYNNEVDDNVLKI